MRDVANHLVNKELRTQVAISSSDGAFHLFCVFVIFF